MNNYNDIYNILKQDSRLITDEGELLKNKLYELAIKMDSELIKLLINNEITKQMFFKDINGVLVFDKVEFGWIIDSKEFLPNSFTAYKNTIMLTNEKGDSIKNSKDVVLSFPYKDCILEGGQTKDDESRQERFYNQVLGKSEIDTLLERKVITNAKRYSKNRVEDVELITDEDNLLIKGNNLIALSTLRGTYSNKVKLAYWDIPYNTGSDSFNYNDNFTRSTYLTFIKNRVDVMKELLSEDGILLIHCSFHQFAYLKVLLDEIMQKHMMTFNVLVRHPERILTGDKEFNDVVEYVLVYSNSADYNMPKIGKLKKIDDYVYSIKELAEGKEVEFDGRKAIMFKPDEYKLIKGEACEEKFKTISIRGSLKEKNSSGRFYMKHLNKLVGEYEPMTLFKVDDIGDDIYDYRYFHLPKKQNKNGTYLQGKPTSSDITYTPYPNYIDFMQEYNVVGGEGEVEFRNGKKPEEIIKYLIDIFTDEGDIVLDAFMGSGTTGAVSLKMDRQFIGIEQMDYIKTITLDRLSKLINGEVTDGIKNNFNGNENFIYIELKEWNQRTIDIISNTNSNDELYNIFVGLKTNPYINHQINLSVLKEDEDGFKNLNINDKKKILIDILDKNTLYINYSDMDDEIYNLSDEEKELNKKFYKD